MKLSLIITFFLYAFNTFGQVKDSIPCEDPHFPGGKRALDEFVNKNLKLVDSSLCQRGGIVYVEIHIDSTGKVLNPRIKRGVKREFDLEAIRLFRIMPDWIPMICGGKPKESTIVIPLRFSS